jgi:hypothetical protein
VLVCSVDSGLLCISHGSPPNTASAGTEPRINTGGCVADRRPRLWCIITTLFCVPTALLAIASHRIPLYKPFELLLITTEETQGGLLPSVLARPVALGPFDKWAAKEEDRRIGIDQETLKLQHIMEDFNSETDSDYTSYWRDWVSTTLFPLCYLEHSFSSFFVLFLVCSFFKRKGKITHLLA